MVSRGVLKEEEKLLGRQQSKVIIGERRKVATQIYALSPSVTCFHTASSPKEDVWKRNHNAHWGMVEFRVGCGQHSLLFVS
jgi:hypothetical protein